MIRSFFKRGILDKTIETIFMSKCRSFQEYGIKLLTISPLISIVTSLSSPYLIKSASVFISLSNPAIILGKCNTNHPITFLLGAKISSFLMISTLFQRPTPTTTPQTLLPPRNHKFRYLTLATTPLLSKLSLGTFPPLFLDTTSTSSSWSPSLLTTSSFIFIYFTTPRSNQSPANTVNFFIPKDK